MIGIRHLLVASASVAAIAIPTSAYAQSSIAVPPDEAPVGDQQANASAGDIVVTARRRSESLQGVPVVVSVVGSEQLTSNNATDLTKIGELVPSVIIGVYKSQGGGSIAIRGISSPANQRGFEQAVAVDLDGVLTSDGRVAQIGMFDVRQIEVLKGPQALLFGKNNTAGVISIASADPTPTLEVTGRAAYEFVGNEVTTEAAISGPLADTLGARLAVRYRNLDGWLRNTARPIANPFYRPETGAPAGAAQLPGASDSRPGEEEILARLTLKGELTPNFTFRLKSFYGHSRDGGAGVASQNIGPCTGPNPRVNGIADPFGDCRIDNRTTDGGIPPEIAATLRDAPADGKSYGELTTTLQSLDLGWKSGPIAIDSTTGYLTTHYRNFAGFDQTTYSQLFLSTKLKTQQFSQELRVTSDFAGIFNFMAGGFYQTLRLDARDAGKLNDGAYNAAANQFSAFNNNHLQTGRTLSGFVQLMLKPIPTVEIAGGARYTSEHKEYHVRGFYGIGPFATQATVYPGSDQVGVLKGRLREDNVSPEVTINWRPTSDLTIFGSYRTGFKSGGFGQAPLQIGTRIENADFASETSKGFEIGLKGIFLNGRMRLNVAGFAYNFNDLQVNTYDPTRIAYTISNVGSVRQRGGEAELNFQVLDILRLRGAVAYTHNRFHDYVGQCYGYTFPTGATRGTATPPPNCSFVNTTSLTLQQDFENVAPARAPSWAGSVGADLDVPLGDYKVGLSVDAFYSGAYYAAETRVPSSRQDSFWRLNASARIADIDDRWGVSVIGRNLTNRYYLLYAADRTGGGGVPGTISEQRGVVARGREVALQLTGKF